MDEEIRIITKIKIIVELEPAGMDIAQLIVRQKDKNPAALYEFISAATVWMTESNGGNRYRPDVKFHGACIRISQPGGDILIFNRKIRRCHDL